MLSRKPCVVFFAARLSHLQHSLFWHVHPPPSPPHFVSLSACSYMLLFNLLMMSGWAYVLVATVTAMITPLLHDSQVPAQTK